MRDISDNHSNVPSTGDIPQLTEHLFRHESGRLVSVLTGKFGIARLQLVEDVVQEALIRALQTWPYRGIPENPSGWLMQTAKNLALDTLRRENRFLVKQPEIVAGMKPSYVDSHKLGDEIADHQLRLMFACCHPSIPQEAQTALALKTLCGLSAAEIASAFLTTEAAIAKRLTRARQKIREEHIQFEIPEGEKLSVRLESVLQVLYFFFNEGYKASHGDDLIKENLCYEAIRLVLLLTEHPTTNKPETNALAALMMLHGGRLPARVDDAGNVLRLKEQDRSKWDQRMISRGLIHLGLAASGDNLSEYHLQAAIAACHCTAQDFPSTDWVRILKLYDQWSLINDSPVIALSRAVAVMKVHGPKAGIETVHAIQNRSKMESYYLFHAVLGDFESQHQNYSVAINHYRKSLELTEVKSEQVFLTKQLEKCERKAALV